MNSYKSTACLMQRFNMVLLGLASLFFSSPILAQATPVSVGVDHQVTVTYSPLQPDTRKGIYTTQVRIKNRSDTTMYAPLRLAFNHSMLKGIRLLNAHGIGKNGHPYFEFALPSRMLAPGVVTGLVKVTFSVEGADGNNAKSSISDFTSTLSSAQKVSAAVKLVFLEPGAFPNVVPAGQGKTNIHFVVQAVGGAVPETGVFLRRVGARKSIPMNDRGVDGDLKAGDGVFGTSIVVDTDNMQADACDKYEVVAGNGRTEVVSPATKLCVSSFPVRAAASEITHSLQMEDGSKALADEVIISVKPNTKADTIRRLAGTINAKVVGSIPSHNLFQLKLPAAVSVSRLLEIIAQMQASPEIEFASPNGIGSLAGVPPNGSQHGLKQVLEYDTWSATKKAVWDSGAIFGSNETVVVLDSGINRQHPDFGSPGNCQLAENDCGLASTDITPYAHGTMVAGIIAASGGAAGVAQGSKIHSIVTGTFSASTYAITLYQMIDAFDGSYTNNPASISNSAKGYITANPSTAKIVNASIYGGPYGVLYASLLTQLCTAVNNTVLNGTTPVALVVVAAGNKGADDNYYPARCNDHAALSRHDLLITVANSSSVSGAVTDTSYMDTATTQTTTLAIDQLYPSSNRGAWVDIAAPGVQIYAPISGSGYDSPIGTSYSAPMVAGAAAILNSCGVALDQIESTLRTSTASVTMPVSATLPAGGTVPRLDVYSAMSSVNHAPTGVSPASSSVNENSPVGTLISTLSANDVDTCDRSTFSIIGGNPGGFTVDANTGQLRVGNLAAMDYEASHSYPLTVQVTDFFGASFSQAMTVNLNNLNDTPPVITSNGGGASASVSIAENSTAVTTVTATDADNLLPLTYTLSGTLADEGWFNLDSTTGVLTFVVPPDFEAPVDVGANNVYDIIVQVSDGTFTDSQSIAVTVTNANEAPVANDDTLGANQDTPVTYPASLLLGNDTDVDAGTTLVIAGVTNGANGTVVLNGDGTVTFTPNPGFVGAANFTYTASDGSLPSNVATVTVNVAAVNHAPVANDDTLAATEDIPETYAAAQLLGNDTDVDAGTTLAVAGVTSGAGGTAVLNGDGTVTFTPNPNFNGVANFTYTATDGSLASNVATVTVNVAAANDPATGQPFISGTRTKGQTLTAKTLTATPPNPIVDADGLGAFNYQWLASGSPVGGNSDTYVLTQADVGTFMSVCVSFTDGGGTAEGPLCSATDGIAVGDPHITTVDGLHYDFQGAGEFVALRGANGTEIQLRMAAVSTAPPLLDSYSGLTSGVSVNTAVAARVGKHRVTYQPDTSPGAAGGTFVLRVDGVPTTLQADGVDLGDGGRVISQASGIQIDFPDQTTLMVNTTSWPFYGAWWLHVSVFHTSAYDGIMGARSKGSWLPRLSDGSVLGMMPATLHARYVDLYVKFANSWRVNKETSLFDYAEGTSTATFTNKVWPTENGPYASGSGPVAKPLGLKAAQLACRGVVGKNEKADCIFDVRVMGNANLAKGHLQAQKIRNGLTAVDVRDDRDVPEVRETVTFTATVVRHAAIGRLGATDKGAPTGAVQFTVNGKRVGRPVKLDARGQARWKVSRKMIEKQTIGAQYIPPKGSVFLPSRSIEAPRPILQGKLQ